MTVDMSQKEMEGLAQINCSLNEFCSYFDCHHTTVEARIKKYYGPDVDFKTFKEMFKGKGRVSLRRTVWREALKGKWDPLKFLCKNELEMVDEIDVNAKHSAPGGGPIQTQNVPMSLEELRAEAQRRGLPVAVFEAGIAAVKKDDDPVQE